MCLLHLVNSEKLNPCYTTGVEGDLRLYLEQVATAEDVQCYVKNNPFGQPHITKAHPDWKYYLPALKTLTN